MDQPSSQAVNERLKAEDGGLGEGQSQEQKEVNRRLGHHDHAQDHLADHNQVQDRLGDPDEVQKRLGDYDQVQDRLDNQFHQEEMSEGSEVVI